MSRTLLVSTLAVAALVTSAGGVAVAATGGQPAAKPTTLTFTAKQVTTVVQSRTRFDLSDNDVKAGKKIGVDVLSCVEKGGKSSVCDLAFAYDGGTILGHLTLSDSTGAVSGRITGGTAAFAHVKGTITGQATSRSAVSIKLVYTA